MLKNVIKIALRNMKRNKIFSIINIAGLSVGVACCLMLLLYMQDELRYDKHHQDGERIFRITSAFSFEDFKVFPRTSPPIAWGIKDEIAEFETVTRIAAPPGVTQNLIRYEDNKFYEEGGYVADSTVFDIFSYEFLEGNAEKALTHANSVVICEALSKKLFGQESALEKIININQGGPSADFKVTGVFRNDKNSHLQANFFVAMSSSGWADYTRRSDVENEWAGQNFMYSYVKLYPGYRLDDVVKKVNNVYQKHGAEDLKALGMSKNLGLEPLRDIYLYSSTDEQTPRILYVYVIASIAIFILLIACINFMNLSTAKATQRATEVGLRKTLGANRDALIRQFLSETLVIVVFAILASGIIIQLALPYFNQVTEKNISLNSTNAGFMILSLIAITLVTSLAAGSYPAFYLSSFKPANILKGKSVLNTANSLLRRSLVVFQFVIAITLVCGMIIVTRQINYMIEEDLGFNATHKIVLPLRTQSAQETFITLRNELSKIPSVNGITATNNIPGARVFSDFGLYPQGSSMEKAVLIRTNWVEPNYPELMGIKIIAGNDFPKTRNADSWNKIILNREAANKLGYTPEKIAGETLYFDWQGERYGFEVIGVMENYHQTSLKDAIYPLLFRVNEKPQHNFVVVDVDAQSISQSLAAFEKNWKSINPDTPFEYSFLDEHIQQQYEADRKVSLLISVFTVIAMIISCMGLYGLSTYMAERRFKEIGVRKVLGASVQQIVTMMSGEFVKLVLIAFVIAIPLSLYGMQKWLEGFAYKVSPDISLYLIAGCIALLIAVITISFESIKAASGNPVNALRNE